MYPKHGPGQLWEKLQGSLLENGGEIHHGNNVIGIESKKNIINSIKVQDESTGELKKLKGLLLINHAS